MTISRVESGRKHMDVTNLQLSETSFAADAAAKTVQVGKMLTVGSQQAAGVYTGSYTVNLTY